MAPLWGSSEAREAQVIWTITQTGEWILPLRNGLVPSKPPLFHWFGAVVNLVFGVAPLVAARLVSLLAATGIVVLTLKMVTLYSFETSSRDDQNRLLVVSWAILTSTYILVSNAGDAKVDMLFSFWVTYAVAGYLHYSARQAADLFKAHRVLWLVCAVAALAKGPLGFVLPLTLAFTARAWTSSASIALKEFARPRFVHILAPLITLTWYLAAYRVGGEAFLDRHLFFENIQRVTGAEDMNSEPWYFYLFSFPRSFFPWALVGIVAIWKVFRLKHVSREETLGYALCLVGLVLFSIPSGKRHSYLIPLIPWFTVSSALLFERIGRNLRILELGTWQKILGSIVYVIGIVILFLLINPEIVLNVGFSPQSIVIVRAIESVRATVQWAGIAFLLAAISLRYRCSEGITHRSFVTAWTAVALILYSILYASLTIKGELKGFYRIAEDINLKTSGQTLTVVKSTRDEYFDPIFYYLDRRVMIAEDFAACSGTYLIKAETLGTNSVEIIARYGETPTDFGKPPKRELVLFRCQQS